MVPKKSGYDRIRFVKLPIENVLREFHPIHTVDQTLLRMNGAKLFSKHDAANRGY